MLHGIILARHAERLATTTRDEFAEETRSFFGSGVQLQELYLSPELLAKENWDDLAASAKWARTHADVLKDSHWIGGDPAKLETYGWAAWTPRLGVLTLRNPSARSATIVVEVQSAFELPTGTPTHFRITSAYADCASPVTRMDVSIPVKIALRPFQVLVLEAEPKKD
jgi:hypothetical protein